MELKIAPDLIALVEASKLSLTDDFMQHIPETEEEAEFKKLLVSAIEKGIPDFYRPRLDPSFNKDGEICFEVGLKPAVEKSYDFWEDKAKSFWPEHNSRLGTKDEYVAFLGVLIKKLVASGWSVEEAWEAVCNNSFRLGCYLNTNTLDRVIEPTGSREIAGFFDLANTYKILARENEIGHTGSGCYLDYSYSAPVASFLDTEYIDIIGELDVGWIVFEK